MLSSIILSLNLYVSQQHSTGTPASFAIMDTVAVPAREYIAPLDKSEWVPSKRRETVGKTAPRAGRRR